MNNEMFKLLVKNRGKFVKKKNFNLSPEEVELELQSLVDENFPIENRKNKVMLVEFPDILNTRTITYFLNKKNVDMNFMHFDEVDSTNIVAKDVAKTGYNGMIVASTQTKGVGRCGRSFDSPEGGVYFSMILTGEDFQLDETLKMVMITGIALCEAMRDSGFDAKIKWPNDIYIGQKKVAGILCEMLPQRKGMIVGIGVNVNTPNMNELKDIATSMYLEDSIKRKRAEIIANIIYRLNRVDRKRVKRNYRNLTNTLGQKVYAVNGKNKMLVTAVDIDDNGFLIIEKDGERQKFITGDVSIRW